MKKIMIGLLALGIALFFLSCEEDGNSFPIAQEEALILQIVEADNIEALGVEDLPADIQSYVKQHHAPFDIEWVFLAPQLGYEVMMENGLCLFFGMNSKHLNHDGMHNDWGNQHGWNNSGGSYCLFGDSLDVTDLPQVSLDYLSANYSGDNVVTVVIKPSGKLGVELSSGAVLMFWPGGDFLHTCDNQSGGGQHGHGHDMNGGPGWHCDPAGHMGQGHNGQGGMGGHHGNMGNPPASNEPCWGGMWMPADNLPAPIPTHMSTHHPNVTIDDIIQTFSGKYFMRLSDCERLVFDENGNMLFDSEH